jgi:response regulator RpfG family c-di-GMP phosphodiesterase
MTERSIVIFFLFSSVVLGAGLLWYIKLYLPHELSRRYRTSFKAFSKALQLRFPAHAGKASEVLSLSLALADKVGLPEDARERLEMSVWLKDLGLCSLPYRLINNKPIEEWSDEETDRFRQHPKVGANMISQVPSIRDLAEIVADHHTPFGSNPDAPIEARIVALTTGFLWHQEQFGTTFAFDHIHAKKGSLYDPDLVSHFAAVIYDLHESGGISIPARQS